MVAFSRRSYSGIAAVTTLNGDITNASSAITITSATGYPDGSAGNFTINIGSEVIDIATRSGNTLTVATSGRGFNGTTAAAHTSGAPVELVYTAYDADEANAAVANTIGKATGAGQQLISTGTGAFAALDVKGDGKITIGNGTTATSKSITGDITLTNAGVVTLVANAVLNIVEPIGTPKLWFNPTYDTARYLPADGAAVSRATYSDLYTALGGAASPWGQGNGTTTFNTPKIAGRAIMGAGAGSGLTSRTAGDLTGSESVTLSAAESGVPAHTHTTPNHTHTDSGHTHTVSHDHSASDAGHVHGTNLAISNVAPLGNIGFGDFWQGGGSVDTATGFASITVGTANPTSSSSAANIGNASPTTNNNSTAAAANAHTNMQPSIAVQVLIRYA